MPEIRKSPRQAALEHAPWRPAGYEDADVAAFQALADGKATPDQQKRALRWLIERGAATYDLSYRPGGEDGARDTIFAEGRRFVGLQVVKILKLKVGQTRREQ